MPLFLLIRHGHNDWVGKRLAGRLAGLHLNDQGRAAAMALAESLAATPLTAICSSPLERAQETAAAIADRHGMPVETSQRLQEIDIGDWSGRTLQELAGDEHWRRYNEFRTGVRPPGGETTNEVQGRMVAEIEVWQNRQPDGLIALVGHGDPLKTAIAHFVGIPIDHLQRLEIAPASVSLLEIGGWGARLLGLNLRGQMPEALHSFTAKSAD
jgi:broad specificity phosphatase PhoE